MSRIFFYYVCSPISPSNGWIFKIISLLFREWYSKKHSALFYVYSIYVAVVTLLCSGFFLEPCLSVCFVVETTFQLITFLFNLPDECGWAKRRLFLNLSGKIIVEIKPFQRRFCSVVFSLYKFYSSIILLYVSYPFGGR